VGPSMRRAGDKDDSPLFAHAAMPEMEPDVLAGRRRWPLSFVAYLD
jgi:hypothetical protein